MDASKSTQNTLLTLYNIRDELYNFMSKSASSI